MRATVVLFLLLDMPPYFSNPTGEDDAKRETAVPAQMPPSCEIAFYLSKTQERVSQSFFYCVRWGTRMVGRGVGSVNRLLMKCGRYHRKGIVMYCWYCTLVGFVRFYLGVSSKTKRRNKRGRPVTVIVGVVK